MRKITSTLVVAALAIVALAASSPSDQKQIAVIGQPAPQFSLQDQNGNTVTLSEYLGKLVVLEWFNNECPIVQRHYKDDSINKLARKYIGKGVVWLAINTTHDKTNADNKKIAADWKINRPILNDAKDGAIGHKYRATNTPHMYIIDKAGKLVYMGAIDNDTNGDKFFGKINYIDQALSELLAGKPVSVAETKAYGCSIKYSE